MPHLTRTLRHPCKCKSRRPEAVKSYLTRLNDRYRMPYDKRVTDHPRQCVFIGTTNKEQFLTDRTGNRRFYPVKVNQSGYELFDREQEIREYIKQCWAEAKVLYDMGAIQPFADRNLVRDIRQMQEKAVEDDYRIGMIESYLEDKTETCVLDLWINALRESEYSKPTRKDSSEIVIIMQSMSGWVKQKNPKRFPAYGLQKWWSKTDSEEKQLEIVQIDEDLPF